MEKFWMVYRIGGNSPTYQHQTPESAVTEARRLARANPDQTFVVLEAMERYWAEPIPVSCEVLSEPTPPEIPF